MRKKFFIISGLIVLIFGIFLYRTYTLTYKKHSYYLDKYVALNEIYVTGSSAPRGRILDINGKILVDNIGINEILYHKSANITKQDELDIALSLAKLTNYTYNYNETKLKDFFLILYPEQAEKLITEEELQKYSERKLTKTDLTNLKISRITPLMLESLTKEEKYSSYFYFLMNDGYIYDNKILLSNISDELYANILEASLPGIFGETSWSRKYPYNDTLKSIFGTISNSLPKEKASLLTKGYSYTDKIGISGLEEYYEDYLKGKKAIYKVENDKLILKEPAERGNDLILEIDIDMELEIENIIKEQIIKAKKLPNTEYYHESYVLIGDPNTGAIKALSGIRINDKGEFQDVSINVIKNAYTVGSVVKAASHTVGYQNKVIDIGTTLTDSCVKLANIPAKCSFKRLGRLNDIRALAMSSNYYQFITALGVAGYKYTYNMEAPVTINDFNKYRDTFKSFGLGTTTGIDLFGESTGLEGTKVAPDLLLNLAIGQYDLYTPTSLLQYINTVANSGSRLKLNLMHSIKNGDNIVLENKVMELNQVNLSSKYFERIQKGLREVIKSGTGYWYVNPKFEAAGKTGTSESYIDSDYDGKLDAYVLSNTFAMYAPFENPKYSLVVISPNVSNLDAESSSYAPVNRLIARKVNDFLLLGS